MIWLCLLLLSPPGGIEPGTLTPDRVADLVRSLASEDRSEAESAALSLGANGEDSIPALLEALASDNPQARELALAALGQMGEQAVSATDAVCACTHDPERRVRLAAGWAAGEIPGAAARVVPELVALLDDPDPEARAYTADALSTTWRAGGPAVQPLIALFLDQDELVREEAARAVGRLDDLAVPALARSLRSPDPQVRAYALLALQESHAAALPVVGPIAACLSDANSDVRQNAAWALAEIPGAPLLYVSELARCLDDPAPCVRRGALWCLEVAETVPESALPDLLACLRHENANVREGTYPVLALLGPQGAPAVGALRDAVRRPRAVDTWPDRERLGAVRALAAMGEAAAPAADDVAATMLDLQEGGLREPEAEGALAALSAMGEPGLRHIRSVAVRERSAHRMVEYAWALGYLGAEAAPALVALLDYEPTEADTRAAGGRTEGSMPVAPIVLRWWVQSAAVEALGRIGPPARAAVRRLRELAVAEGPGEVCSESVTALYAIGDHKAAVTAMTHPGGWRRPAVFCEPPGAKSEAARCWGASLGDGADAPALALSELARIGPPARVAVAPMRRALGSDDAWVRLAACEALVAVGEPRRALPTLLRELHGEDPALVAWAVRVLGKSGPVARLALPHTRALVGTHSRDMDQIVFEAEWAIAGGTA